MTHPERFYTVTDADGDYSRSISAQPGPFPHVWATDAAMTWPQPERGTLADILPLLQRFHAYGGGGCVGDVWVCRDGGGRLVAGWMWTPPAPGAALRFAPSCPAAVLSLSRMVAIPKAERDWQISKPLLWIMRHGLDRGRWPVLLTYSDAGAGHQGLAYMASRWKRGETTTAAVYEDADGVRRSPYTDGGRRVEGLTRVGSTETKPHSR